jgi:hypothetical protein
MIPFFRLLASVLLWQIAASAPVFAQQTLDTPTVMEAVERLKPGEFLWLPQVSPEGPVLLVVSLPRQRAVLYRNGVPIGISTVSTGRKGHVTPTGIFTVLEKDVEHYSSIYDSAPMPYMQRLTWGGVALHGGHLPGYPASHGCIRLPVEFARLLYGVTSLGMTVVVTADAGMPRLAPTVSAGILGGADDANERPYAWHPERSPQGPVSIVVSGADRRVIVLRNGREIGSAPVAFSAPVSGTAAYLLQSVDANGHHWTQLALGGEKSGGDAETDFSRYKVDPGFGQAVASIVSPGTTLVVTADTVRTGRTDALVEGD